MGRRTETQSHHEERPWCTTRARWVDVVLAGVAAAVFTVLVGAQLGHGLLPLLNAPIWKVAAGLVAVLLCLVLIRERPLIHFVYPGNMWRFPPLSVACVVGVALVFAMLAWSSDTARELGFPSHSGRALCIAGVLCTALVVLVALGEYAIALVRGRRPRKTQPPFQPRREPATLDSFEDLRRWLQTDDAVTSSQDDAFELTRIATRMASRLAQEPPPAQVVLGRLGSGKTTLRHLVEEELARRNDESPVRIVAVELWPFETARAAVSAIVQALVDRLGDEVDVTALRGLPSMYADAMSSAGGPWAALAKMGETQAEPLKLLNEIDRIACTIKVRYVVWIEDLERFAGVARADDSEPESLEQSERLSPVRALLQGLGGLRSVTVVTATTTLQSRFDLEKIARFVEEIPDLTDAHVLRLLAVFRRGCMEYRYIDPAAPEARSQLNRIHDLQDHASRTSVRGNSMWDVNDALPVFCRTPRVLKQALRSCLEFWDSWYGEIDFDDLLVMTLLKVGHPRAFAVLQQHLGTLRRDYLARGDQRKAEAMKAWEDAVRGLNMPERTTSAVFEVAKFVFPEGKPLKPQGLAQHHHADYWMRFQAMPELEEAELDQLVLNAISKSDDAAILAVLENATSAPAVYDFRHLIPPDRTKRLLVPLVERLAQSSRKGGSPSNEAGFITLWSMWLRLSETGELSPEEAFPEVRRTLDLAIPANLSLAAEIEEHFVNHGDGTRDLLSDEGQSKARAYLRNRLLTTCQGNAGALAEGLKGANRYTLSWLTWGLDRIRSKELRGLPFDGWDHLSPTILDAARLDPREVLPQLAGLVTQSSLVRTRGPALSVSELHQFDHDLAERLFGSADTVLDLFAHEDPDTWTDPSTKTAILAARNRSAQQPPPAAQPQPPPSP